MPRLPGLALSQGRDHSELLQHLQLPVAGGFPLAGRNKGLLCGSRSGQRPEVWLGHSVEASECGGADSTDDVTDASWGVLVAVFLAFVRVVRVVRPRRSSSSFVAVYSTDTIRVGVC